MAALFSAVVDMSLTAAVVIVVVMLVRALLTKAPKKFSYLLWSVVAFRLCIPVSFQSVFSIFTLGSSYRQAGTPVTDLPADTGALPLSENTGPTTNAPVDTGSPLFPETPVTVPQEMPETLPSVPMPPQAMTPGDAPVQTVNWESVAETALMTLWILGVAAMLLYGIVSYIRIWRNMRNAIRIEGNVYGSDKIVSPFTLGFIRPKIYLPFGLDQTEQSYIVSHEKYHVKRLDHLIKLFAYILLSVHWFNPLCWLAFNKMSLDMEMSCDERILSLQGDEEMKKQYTTTLLSFAEKRRFPTPHPIAFIGGRGSTKARIKHVLYWKKPKAWLTVLACLLCVTTLVACAANTADTAIDDPPANSGTSSSGTTSGSTNDPTDTNNNAENNGTSPTEGASGSTSSGDATGPTVSGTQKTDGSTTTGNPTITGTTNTTAVTGTISSCTHTWGQWAEKTPATCNKTGVKERICINCQKTESREIARSGHKESDWIIDKVAKVSEEGHKYTQCVYCNQKIQEKAIPAITEDHTHSASEWITTQAPTCTKSGSQSNVCSCGKTIATKEIPSKGHAAVIDKAVAATCTSAGLAEGSHCSVCSSVIIKQKTIDPLPHVAVTDQPTAATCTSEGLTEGSHCSVCGKTIVKQTVIPKTAHAFIGGSCSCGVTESLKFTLSSDATYYILSGIGTYTGTAVEIPETYNGLPVREIASSAFHSNTSITSVTFNKSINKVGEWVFYGCRSLKEVHIKDVAQWCSIAWGSPNWNPLYYAKNLYLNADLLTDLSIPDTVTEIKANTFPGCTSLKSVTLGDNVHTIGQGAFRECSSLTSLSLGKKIKTIETYAFYRCTALSTDLNFSDSLKEIGDYAFQECYKISCADFGSSLQVIGEGAFLNCILLKDPTIPASTQKIGKYAFKNCSSVTNVYFEKASGWICCHSSYPTLTMGESSLSHPPSACAFLVDLYNDRVWECG